MTRVEIPAVWVAEGHLPPTCARHGVPMTTWTSRSFYTRTPWWVFLLFVVSLLIALIVSLAIRTTVSGRLPSCSRCKTERRRFVWSALGAWVASLTLLFVVPSALSVPSWFLFVLFGLVLAALIFSFAGDQFRVTGSVSKDRTWVELKGVSEPFAAAIRQALSAPAPAVEQPSTTPASPAPLAPSAAHGASRDILPGR
jgi:hypothetical protein